MPHNLICNIFNLELNLYLIQFPTPLQKHNLTHLLEIMFKVDIYMNMKCVFLIVGTPRISVEYYR